MKLKKSNEVNQAAGTKIMEKAITGLCNSPAYTNPQAAYMVTMEAMSSNAAETPVTVKLWRQLYEVVQIIRQMEPWKYLDETMRITLLLPGRDEPVYIVVMGNAEMTYGIGIYPGFESLRRLLSMGDVEEEGISIAFEQYCINLYFGEKDELQDKDLSTIEKLGIKISGESEWPYFRSMKPGFLPWHINRDEAKLTLEALQNFSMAFASYAKEGIEVDFENGQTLLRFYDSDTDMWYNAAYKMPPVPFISPKMMIPDGMVSGIKKKKKNKAKLGFIMSYIPVPFQQSKKHRPRLPLVGILANLNDGMIVDHAVSGENPAGNLLDARAEFIEFLFNYVENNGRPASIAVPNEDTHSFLEDFASKLGIKLVIDERLTQISAMFTDMMGGFELIEDDLS